MSRQKKPKPIPSRCIYSISIERRIRTAEVLKQGETNAQNLMTKNSSLRLSIHPLSSISISQDTKETLSTINDLYILKKVTNLCLYPLNAFPVDKPLLAVICLDESNTVATATSYPRRIRLCPSHQVCCPINLTQSQNNVLTACLGIYSRREGSSAEIQGRVPGKGA